MISPFSARQLACPNVCQPARDDPRNAKSGMNSWVAAKMADSNPPTAAIVEIRVFLDVTYSLEPQPEIQRRTLAPLIGKVHAFVNFVIVQRRSRRKKTNYFHLLAAGVVKHVYRALRKQHRGSRSNRRNFAIHQHTARSTQDIDDFLTVRMAVRGPYPIAGRHPNDASGTLVRRYAAVRN